MKVLGLFIGLFISIAYGNDIHTIRKMYQHAVESEENTEKFYQYIQTTNYTEDKLMAGYYGCALTLKASIADKLGDRISFFRKGKKMIEDAISSEPNNIELRMIRLSIQINVPIILRYRKNIEEDKDFIMQHVNTVTSPELKKIIKAFMASTEVFQA